MQGPLRPISSSVQALSRPSPSSPPTTEINELVEQMLGSMRPSDLLNPDMMAAGAISMMAMFPIEVCRQVANPGSGYPSTERFAPTLQSLRVALEEAARPGREAAAREVARLKQVAERKLDAQAAALPAGPRPTYEELQRRCAEGGIFIGQGRAKPAAVNADAFREQYGISQDAWDAIPNA
jgi:hypothetical protein